MKLWEACSPGSGFWPVAEPYLVPLSSLWTQSVDVCSVLWVQCIHMRMSLPCTQIIWFLASTAQPPPIVWQVFIVQCVHCASLIHTENVVISVFRLQWVTTTPSVSAIWRVVSVISAPLTLLLSPLLIENQELQGLTALFKGITCGPSVFRALTGTDGQLGVVFIMPALQPQSMPSLFLSAFTGVWLLYDSFVSLLPALFAYPALSWCRFSGVCTGTAAANFL